MFMKLKYTVLALCACIFLLGNGCLKNNIDTTDSFIPQGGVSLYVRSLDQSYKSILAEGKKIDIVEYKLSEFTEKGKIKNIFLTVPNNKVSQLADILLKESNDKNVSGLKNLYGDFLPEERPKNGTTNFKIALIDVIILK